MENKKEGKLIWITGLTSSGKTELAKRVFKSMKEKYENTVHLDGDNLRDILQQRSKESYSFESRKNRALLYSRLCSFLTNQKINVIISTVSLFYDVHKYNRENNEQYYEIFLNVNENILSQRNKKRGLDTPDKNIVGTHINAEFPKNPSLTLQNNLEEDIPRNIEKILKFIEEY